MRGRRMGPGVGRPLMRAAATTAVVAGTASVVSGQVHRHQEQKYNAQDQAQYEHQVYEQQQMAAQQQAAMPAPVMQAPAAPAQPEYMVELGKLGELRAQGLITEEEFNAKKKLILGI
jgi:type IV secretory pathway VirB9-like protein